MAARPTDECAACGRDLRGHLQRVFEEIGRWEEMAFEFECPSCGARLVVTVDMFPTFTTEVVNGH